MENPYKKSILVTGGAGFIGSNFVENLIAENEITVIDNLSNSAGDRFIKGFERRDNFKLITNDINKDNAFDSLGKFDLVVHFAANPEVNKRYENPDISFDDINGTKNVLKFMKEKEIKNMIFASSSVVYGDPESIPVKENQGPYKPISAYGAYKLASEGMITAYSHYYGIKAGIFRFANVVGKNQTHGVILDFINKLKVNPKELTILGDGTQSKSYIHVSDCVSAIMYLNDNIDKTEIINLGNTGMTSVLRIADIVKEKLGLKDVNYKLSNSEEGRGWKGDVKKIELDTNKSYKMGWKNRYDSDEAINKAVSEILKQVTE
ncbi:MAG: NAD-dependent epimerase/dehydratase family protein [Thermodesulfobium sp.]